MLSSQLAHINLKQQLADFGFESHEDYRFVIKQLLATPAEKISCLSLAGDSGRRKTAFAHALGLAVNFDHVLYHDFSQLKAPEPALILPEPTDKTIAKERPISALDRVVSDACAFSEAENTLLIFDQLQMCDFRHQVRLHQLLLNNTWVYPKNEFIANPQNLYLILISEENLYHSLQKNSFKVWVSNTSYNQHLPNAQQLNQEPTLQPVLDVLAIIFKQLQITPTQSELLKLIHDIKHHIHTVEDIITSIYGWVEGIDYLQLKTESLQPVLNDLLKKIDQYLGIDELEIFE